MLCDVARQPSASSGSCTCRPTRCTAPATTGSFTEDDILEPSSPYSASKAGSDLIALAYQTTYGLPVVVTRSSNNYGPYQFPEKVIPLFVTNLLDGKKVPLYGDGQNVRDWLYVEENCAGIDAVVRNGVPGQVYNLGGGHELTNRELTEQAARAVRARRVVRSSTSRTASATTAATRSPTTSSGRSTGSRRIDPDEGLARTVAWYRDHRDWWEPLKQASAQA